MNSKCQFGKGGLRILQGKIQTKFLLTNAQIEKMTPSQLCSLNERCTKTSVMPPMNISSKPAKNGKIYYFDPNGNLTPDDYLIVLEPVDDTMSSTELVKSLIRILKKREIPIESVSDKFFLV